MCIKCMIKEALEETLAKETGAKFVDAVIGTASSDSLHQLQQAREQAKAINQEREETIRAINEQYDQQLEAAKAKRAAAWRAAFASVGLPEDADDDYSISLETGLITLREMQLPQEAPSE